MSSSRTNHQFHRFQRHPRVFPVIPYKVFRIICLLRVYILSIRVGLETYIEPPSGTPVGGTVSAAPPVIILVPCSKRHVIVVIQAISYNHICNEWYCNWNFRTTVMKNGTITIHITLPITHTLVCPAITIFQHFEWFKENEWNLTVTEHYHVMAYFHLKLLDMLLYKMFNVLNDSNTA